MNPGDKFGRLTIVGEGGKTKYNQKLMLCRCDCGKSVRTRSDRLKAGTTRSCGCIAKEIHRSWSKTMFPKRYLAQEKAK